VRYTSMKSTNQSVSQSFNQLINQSINCWLPCHCVVQVSCGQVSTSRGKRSAPGDTEDFVHRLYERVRRDTNAVTSHFVQVTFTVTVPYSEPGSPEAAYEVNKRGTIH
jgi:hypothetical protein